MSITKRIDAITEIPEEYAVEAPPAPKSVKIELTGRCNFNCNFCAHSQRLREVGDMSKIFYERIVTRMRMAGVEELGLFYLGESFLCSWLPEAIRYAKDVARYPYVFLTTNGSLSNQSKVVACMEAGLDSLKFSLNYANEDQFKEIARVKPKYFHNILSNLKDAFEARNKNGFKTRIYASYIEYDGEQGERMQEYIENAKPYCDEIYALPLYNQAALIDKEGWEFVQGNRGRQGNLRDPLPCWSIFTEGHISSDGRLSACCFDHDNRFNMGDLNEVEFMDAWHSEKFRELRRHHLAKNVNGTICEKCVAY